MKIIEAQGYSKEKAFEETGLDINLKYLRNATQTWKNSGSPIGDKKLKDFIEGYIKDKRVPSGYIVIEPASDDTRMRPYKVINEATKGKRKSTTTYQVKEAVLDVKTKTVQNEEGEDVEVSEVKVLSAGAVEARAGKKDEAVKLMKSLIKENRKNYVIEIVKEITTGQKYASYGVYTPSKSAEVGKFIFFSED